MRRSVQFRRTVAALNVGPIHAIGGSVYDVRNRYITTTSDLVCFRHLLQITRTDAGGRPTWVKSR